MFNNSLSEKDLRDSLPYLKPKEQAELNELMMAESRSQPSSFVKTFITADPVDYQKEILDTLMEHKRIAVRSPHAAGKTALASWAVLFGLATFGDDFKIITTASSWRQLTKFLWPEIHKWYRRTKWDLLGKKPELLANSIRVPGGEVFAAASDRPELIEGAHAEKLMYILDEAKAIPDATWDAIEGAFATQNSYALAISTPGDRAGRFFQIHQRAKGLLDWKVRHITLEETIKAKRVPAAWATQRLLQWGLESPIYQARVLGEFPEYSDDSLISLVWIEAAIERYKSEKPDEDAPAVAGLDVARFGSNYSALIVRRAVHVVHLERWAGHSITETTGRAKNRAASFGARLIVDEIGVGAGVIDSLQEQGVNAVGVNVGEAAHDKEHFANLRSEIYWGLRTRFIDGEIAIPDDDNLTGELTSLKFKYTNKGQIAMESKDDAEKRGVASPDLADALCLAYAPVSVLMLSFA